MTKEHQTSCVFASADILGPLGLKTNQDLLPGIVDQIKFSIPTYAISLQIFPPITDNKSATQKVVTKVIRPGSTSIYATEPEEEGQTSRKHQAGRRRRAAFTGSYNERKMRADAWTADGDRPKEATVNKERRHTGFLKSWNIPRGNNSR